MSDRSPRETLLSLYGAGEGYRDELVADILRVLAAEGFEIVRPPPADHPLTEPEAEVVRLRAGLETIARIVSNPYGSASDQVRAVAAYVADLRSGDA